MQASTELDVGRGQFTWKGLAAVRRSGRSKGSSGDADNPLARPLELDIDSRGQVFFALFDDTAADASTAGGTNGRLRAACVKFLPDRHATHSESLGSELSRQLDIATPQVRVLSSGTIEWEEARGGFGRALELAGGDEEGRGDWGLCRGSACPRQRPPLLPALHGVCCPRAPHLWT